MTEEEKTAKAEEELREEEKNEPAAGENPAEESAAAEEAAPEKSEEEKLKEEIAELKDKYLRLMAEFDNFRKRSAKERQEVYPAAIADAVEAFIPLADNFERAASAESTDEKYKAGVMMIFDQLKNAFKKLSVEEISREGEPFDPSLENAVSQVESDELEENTVAQVYQKGYRIGDRIIRHAMVSVVK